MPLKDLRARKNYGHTYYLKHKVEVIARSNKWQLEHKERHKEIVNKWLEKNRDLYRMRQNNRNKKIKMECFLHYSKGKLECECCHDKTFEFLTLDHINGDGNKHRKLVGSGGGVTFYVILRNQNYPSGYRLLCMNCNWAIGQIGYCPHKRLEECL